jgi:hypothetical protein
MNMEKAGKRASHDLVSFEQAIREGCFAVISDDVNKRLGRDPKPVWEIFQDHKQFFVRSRGQME